MARLKGQDNLDDLSGKLTAGFNGVTLKVLESAYKSSGPDAEKTLTDFYLAAERLQSRESEFNSRAKPKAHDLKANLRNTEQLTALRTFERAKQDLLMINPQVGERIASVVENNIHAAATKSQAKKVLKIKAPSPVPA